MKTLMVVVGLWVMATAAALAQTVIFANNSGTPIQNYDWQNVVVTVALYGSTETNLTSDALLTQIGATVNTFAPGLFSGGNRFIGTTEGALVTLQVRAWTGGFSTYDLALAAAMVDPSVGVGCSQCWVQAVGGGTLPTPPITGTGRFQGLILGGWSGTCIVPEPSSLALAVLGAVALFGFRRRRS